MADGISEKPWSDYKESDYSLDQWHRACLIHEHQGAPTSKEQCKLPVRTPAGVLSRAGVHAAAAALAGARGGVQVPDNLKMQAASAIMRLYAKLNEEAPPSMKSMNHSDIVTVNEVRAHFGLKTLSEKSSVEQIHDAVASDRVPAASFKMQGIDEQPSFGLTHDDIAIVDAFLAHFGRKGMKWGQRIFSRGPAPDFSTMSDSQKASFAAKKARKQGVDSLSNAEMQAIVTRLNLERQLSQIKHQSSKLNRGREFVNRQLKTGKTLNEMIAFANSPAGQLISASIRSSGKGRHAGTYSAKHLVKP
jgi:hypothetical protein